MEDLLNPDEIRPGIQVGPYRIERLLGAGGMGQVYAALDTRLNRHVAIKVTSREFAGRFAREAKAIASMNHPHVCTLHDVGPNYLVMELVEGDTLHQVLKKGILPVQTAIDYTIQIAKALQAAHSHGIVHRDLKPANVMVAPSGLKVLDFGLAVHEPSETAEASGATVTMRETKGGEIVGTVRYMSPEQAEGKPANARSDVFALGVVMYEMLCGQPPFQGESTVGLLASILKAAPVAPRKLRLEIPEAVEQIVLQCLEKDPVDRFASAGELIQALEATRTSKEGTFSLPRWVAASAALLALLGAGAYGWTVYNGNQQRGFVAAAIPEIQSLLDEDREFAAYRLYREATRLAPDSIELVVYPELLRSGPVRITSTPPGVSVAIADYLYAMENPEATMVELGTTPLEVEIPGAGFYLIRASVNGQTLTLGTRAEATIELRLPQEADPEGMHWVQESAAQGVSALATPPPAAIPAFWLDTYEVTNEEYQQFIDMGGYSNSEFWTEPFLKDGRELSFAEAMQEFVDETGRAGPSTWRAGTYAENTEDSPVRGVSWYEAMAYARFAGKTLPSYFHWMRASGFDFGSVIALASNFGGAGPSPVTDDRAVARFGHFDMGGNVKEWVSSVIDGRHALLGGSWEEPSYVITAADLRDPFARSETFGFRCALYEEQPDPALLEPFTSLSKIRTDEPIGDEAFEIVRHLYDYERVPVEASEPETDNSSPYWTEETVSFAAPYDQERIIAHILLPKDGKPPYQPILVSPGINVLFRTSLAELGYPQSFLVRSGRALVIPAYKGALERGPSSGPGDADKWPIDFSRTIDYLESRSDTFDASQIGFWGFSWGATFAPNVLSLEPRIDAAVLVVASNMAPGLPANVDPRNFLPRVTAPVLMMNAREDYIAPLESAQDMFEHLGTPAADKKMLVYSGGHTDLTSRSAPMQETLDWFDKYLGSVQ